MVQEMLIKDDGPFPGNSLTALLYKSALDITAAIRHFTRTNQNTCTAKRSFERRPQRNPGG